MGISGKSTMLTLVKGDEPAVVKKRAANRLRVERYRRRNGVQPKKYAGPTKICPVCMLEKDRSKEFYWYISSQGKKKTESYCKSCNQEVQKNRDWAKRLVEQVKARHVKKCPDVPCDLTPEFLRQQLESQNGKCPWFRVQLRTELGGSFRHPDQVSLDRIDNDYGYVQDNVMLVSQAANLARCDSPIEVFAEFVQKVRNP